MLNIPETVKALFLQENVRKNLRISSPSGAFPDICNDRIVKESLKLRESVSSADSLAFGTAEGATLQFEAVGIPNLLGQDIVAALEVDASTLPPELQTVKPDIPYPVFAVPMGTYRVTACPRDKNAVPHRKVTAQQRGNDAADFLSEFNRQLILDGVFFPDKGKVKYFVDPFDILLSNGFLPPEQFISGHETESYLPVDYEDDAYAETIGGHFASGSHGVLTSFLLKAAIAAATGNARRICSVNCEAGKRTDADIKTEAAAMAADMFADGYRFLRRDSGAEEPLTLDELTSKLFTLMQKRWTALLDINFSHKAVSDRIAFRSPILENAVTPLNIYPDSGTAYPNTLGRTAEFIFPVSVQYGAVFPEAVHMLRVLPDEYTATGITITDYSTSSLGYRPTFTFSAETVENDPLGGFRHYWSAELLSSMLLSALELAGGFGQIGRDGRKYIKYLEPSNPYTIGKEISESCWWDEYDLEPIGSIAYTHKGKELLYSFGPGRSVYTVTNTAILDRLRKYTQTQVEDFLNAQLVPHLASIRFTPMELVCRGLPFLEAGDCIAIEADDGTMVPTYVLERNFSGIQHLTDRITADGITIVEVAE